MTGKPAGGVPPRRGAPPSPATYTRRRLLVVATAIGVPAAISTRLGGRRSRPSAAAAGPEGPTRSTTVTSPDTSTTAPPVRAVAGGAIVPGPVEPGPVEPGTVGASVELLQQRLIELRFDPGPVDGVFGPATTRAVWAAKKALFGAATADLDALIDRDTFARLQSAEPLQPRRRRAATSTHVEIYLPEQVIAVFADGSARLVSHMSSGALDAAGNPAEWCEIVTIDTDERGNPLPEPVDKDICGRSKTPGGVFEFYRRVEGLRRGALGSMWNPVYFNYGIAVHGATNVPNHPASHGCVRIPMHIADSFPTLVTNGDAVLVWNGLEEPEDVDDDDRLPVFDYPNPTATTTTSTTSTSSTTTTAPPAAPGSTPPAGEADAGE